MDYTIFERFENRVSNNLPQVYNRAILIKLSTELDSESFSKSIHDS